MAKKQGFVNFRIGEGAGQIITQIAMEHLLYTLNPEKAIRVFTDSFGEDCPYELKLSILRGDHVILVDEQDQTWVVTTREDIHPESVFPKLNIKDWYIRQSDEILESGDGLKQAIRYLMNKMKYQTVKYTFNYETIMKFACGDDEAMLDELRDIEEIDELILLVKVTKAYIDKSIKIQAVIDWARKAYPKDFENENNYIPNWREYNTIVQQVVTVFSELLKADFTQAKEEFPELTAYLDASREIAETIEKGIEPCNIMDNYSAGWLSPEGLFYGLNGEIANMLHQQIADALQEINVVPMYKDNYSEYYAKDKNNVHADACEDINPDSWLEEHGWVKIHGDNVQFGGCLNMVAHRTANININDIQITEIKKYIALCHRGVMRLGWKQQQVTYTMFDRLASGNPTKLNADYFEF